MKPFLTNKGNLEILRSCFKTREIFIDESVLVKTFNEHYTNIVEKSCGKKPTNISQEYGDMSDTEAIHLISKLLKIIKV